MFLQAGNLNGYQLGALDGQIGKVKEFYFDDQDWAIRYLVADTGDWLSGQRVLISPYALNPVDTVEKIIPVHLTKKQIENSPSLDADKPVSRQYEEEYYPYYGYSAYWGGPFLWGTTAYPDRSQGGWIENNAAEGKVADFHLRSTHDVSGRPLQASDGEIGHVEDFVIDDQTWSIRYLIVATRNWLPGRKVLISTAWVERISPEEENIYVNLTRDAVQHAPEFTAEALLTRAYETSLHQHYNRHGYWQDEHAHKRT